MRENYTHNVSKTTYEVTARNDNFSVTFHNLGACAANSVKAILEKAFRDISIACEQTGEIAYNHYYDLGWFSAQDTELCAIAEVKRWLASR